MDNLSDYIPLIIIVGSLLISQLRGKKKKGENPFEKMELPKGIGKENNTPQVKPVIISKPKEKQKTIEVAAKTENLSKKTFIPTVITPENSFQEEQVESTESTYTNFSDTDELKRAIIYSEILRRKEY